MTEGDGTVKSKEVQHAEKIYATLRECREQSGVKKNKGKKETLLLHNPVLSPLLCEFNSVLCKNVTLLGSLNLKVHH
jgi:hypothetical protein